MSSNARRGSSARVKSVDDMTDREAFARMWELTARPGNSAKEMSKLRPKAKRFVHRLAVLNDMLEIQEVSD